MKTVHNKEESYHAETVSCTMNPEINTTVATKDLCLTWFSSGSRHFPIVARVLESFAVWTRLVASFAFFFEKYLKRIMNTRFEVIFILSIIGSLDYWPERRCDPRVMRIRFLPPRSMQTQRSFFDTWNLDRCKRQLPNKICFIKDSYFFIRFRRESLFFLLTPMAWHACAAGISTVST